MLNSELITGFLLWSMTLAASAFFYGQAVQKNADEASANRATVTQLTDMIRAATTLASDAASASRAMRAIVAARTRADTLTDKDFLNALANSAGNRLHCRFDDELMQQLDAARERAAHAAAGGLRGSLPEPAGTGR